MEENGLWNSSGGGGLNFLAGLGPVVGPDEGADFLVVAGGANDVRDVLVGVLFENPATPSADDFCHVKLLACPGKRKGAVRRVVSLGPERPDAKTQTNRAE